MERTFSTPLQRNEIDCGVFMIEFLVRLIKKQSFEDIAVSKSIIFIFSMNTVMYREYDLSSPFNIIYL